MCLTPSICILYPISCILGTRKWEMGDMRKEGDTNEANGGDTAQV